MSKDTNYTVIDNFLSDEKFNLIHSCLTSDTFPWYFQSNISFKNDKTESCNFYMTHRIYDEERPLSNYFELIEKTLLENIYVKSLIRIKANFYPNNKIVDCDEMHSDYDFKHQGAIYSINTNNGGTILKDNTRIKSVANRILFFNAAELHDSYNCTDAKARININLNYF